MLELQISTAAGKHFVSFLFRSWSVPSSGWGNKATEQFTTAGMV